MGGSPLLSLAVTAYPTMGGASSNMPRMRASANPVLLNRTPNVSIAFATMQVSIWRRASSSSWVNEGAMGIFNSFRG
jgi:hypothetical protein